MAVRSRGKQIVIDFRCYLPDGHRVRCVESEGKNTKHNLIRANSKSKAVDYALKHGDFNYLSFFPHGSKSKHFRRPASEILFSEYWEKWLAGKSIGPGTEKTYQYQYKNHIGPYFGHWPIANILNYDIAVFRKSLEKNLKPSSINTYLKPLCQVLLSAQAQGLISDYPCKEISSLPESLPEINPLSFDELRYWLSYLWEKDRAWHDLVLFWSRTGLRPGEVYALKWMNIDFFNHKAMIRESRIQTVGTNGLPKTKHSIRDVDLRPAVIDSLKRQEARTGLINKYVFLNPNGRQWSGTRMRDSFAHYLRLAGLKHRPPKQLRHTFATLHIAAGESITWVSKMLGHADVEITLKKYNRFIPNLTREDGSAFEKVMDSEIGNNLVTSVSK